MKLKLFLIAMVILSVNPQFAMERQENRNIQGYHKCVRKTGYACCCCVIIFGIDMLYSVMYPRRCFQLIFNCDEQHNGHCESTYYCVN